MLQLSKGLNPFGVREVSKQLGLRPTRPMHCLNPFGVREVSKQSYDEMNDDFIRLNPFGVREVSKQKCGTRSWR